MPVPLGAVALGAAAGVAVEYVFARGKPTTKEIATGAVLGALPVGLTARSAVKGVSTVRSLHKFGRHYQPGVMKYSDKVIMAALTKPGKWPYMSLRPQIRAVGSGAAASAGANIGYDLLMSRGGEHTSRSGTPQTRKGKAGKSTPGPSAQKPLPKWFKKKGSRKVKKARAKRSPRYCTVHKRYHYCRFQKDSYGAETKARRTK